jgi:hypothetical protein
VQATAGGHDLEVFGPASSRATSSHSTAGKIAQADQLTGQIHQVDRLSKKERSAADSAVHRIRGAATDERGTGPMSGGPGCRKAGYDAGSGNLKQQVP